MLANLYRSVNLKNIKNLFIKDLVLLQLGRFVKSTLSENIIVLLTMLRF